MRKRCNFTIQQLTATDVKSSYWLIFLLAILLNACDGQGSPTIYIPPTLADPAFFTPQVPVSIIPASGIITSQPPNTPSPECTLGLTFLNDVTIPDGTLVNPKEKLDKRWLVKNSGTCNWDALYGLQLIAGSEMGAPPEHALFPARSVTQVEIHIMFTAPEEPGTHRSAWQARDPQGNLFGDPIFIEIVVTNP